MATNLPSAVGAPSAPRAPLPAPGDRRALPADRRRGSKTRRSARRDRRARRPSASVGSGSERRRARHDRRSGPVDRRFGNDRRGHAARRPLPAEPLLDPMLVFWALNVVCWAAIVAVAMIWGVG